VRAIATALHTFLSPFEQERPMRPRLLKLAVGIAIFATALGGSALAETKIVGNMVVSVSANLSPKNLPRDGRAPVAVSVGWKVSTTDGTAPPQLKTLKIEINRYGILDPTGLPICPYGRIQPASTLRALKNCRSSLVGRGSFAALVALEGQESYVARGKMVIFNSLKGGKPVLFGQIYSAKPFANSFVITFKVNKTKKGSYGTSLTATLPATLRAWGNLTEIQMRLSRKYGYQGERRSFLTANCPTPKGVPITSFDLARTNFAFVGGQQVTSTLTDDCKVRH
jgi:hypothetical protein